MTRLHKKNIMQVCKKYFDIYFNHRNLEGIKELIGKSMTGFGTGKDEEVNDYKDAVSIYKRDIKEAPNKISYRIKKMDAVVFGDNYGCSFGKLDINTSILDQQIKLNNLRFSIVFKKAKKWEIVHMHMSFPSVEHDEDESFPVKELENRNDVLQRRVEKKTKELQKVLKKTKKLAITDKLTGLFNRIEINNNLKNEIKLSKRYNKEFSVILIDIDHFKEVNDNYGHQMGDRCLVNIANLVKKRIRETDIVGRWGGEEFIIICPETNFKDAISLAEDLRIQVSNYTFDINKRLTISSGVASYSKGDKSKDIIKRADDNLYKAKENGRNRVEPN